MSALAYLERVVEADEQAEEELTRLALEGLNSREPIHANAAYWEERHRRRRLIFRFLHGTAPKCRRPGRLR